MAGSLPLWARAPAGPPTALRAGAPLEVPYRQFTLANGLTVILHRDTSVPVVAVNVWYHVGSASERAGRTGFAHLFEHLMFEGSRNVAEGEFDTLLEGAGATNNGSTNNDRTNYYIDLPADALELALFLESDRMGYLLDAMSPERVDGQRDVVKNERRQSYENRPYGMASIVIDEMLYLGWVTPRHHAPGDAALDLVASVLTDGKNSRLYKRLVYDTQMAQDVSASQQSGALGSSFVIVSTARPGRTIEEITASIDEEIERLRREPPDAREVERAVNQIEASFYRRMERVGGFGGKADQLNAYFFAGGGPDYFAEDPARYTSLSPSDVQAAVLQWLPRDRRVEPVVEPEVAR
ncbi:MAG: insulinase family protein [Acidobacteria bacterium]|nr:insulinase family protein [Acidobacteriota bacterium]